MNFIFMSLSRKLNKRFIYFVVIIFTIFNCTSKSSSEKVEVIQNSSEKTLFSCNTKTKHLNDAENLAKITEIKNSSKKIVLQKFANSIISKTNISLGNKNIYIFEDEDTSNAYCIIDGNDNYIIINLIFSKSISNWSGNDNDDIENILVLLHEIGHIVNNHIISNHENELVADRFAGGNLYFLGYSVGDLEGVSEKIYDKFESDTHPSGERRLQALEEGYRITRAKSPINDKDRLIAYLDKNYPLQKIESGCFLMGSHKDRFAAPNEKPQKRKIIDDNFLIGKFEVTQELWHKILGSNPSFHTNCVKCPVEKVDLNDINKFLVDLNEQSGRNYRLPTEIEWEYTASYKLSENFINNFQLDNLDSKSWNITNSNLVTHPVGEGNKKHNPYIDIYDMLGNVTEWCSSSFKFYDNDKIKNNAFPNHFVQRGGSVFYVKQNDWRLGYRIRTRYPEKRKTRFEGTGFRLILDPD